jgi:hypothetical protein
MAKKGLDSRHRDTTGRIDKKHGNTRVKALRKTYGAHFAKGRRSDTMLKTLLAETGTESLPCLSAQAPQIARYRINLTRLVAVRSLAGLRGLQGYEACRVTRLAELQCHFL